MGFQSHSDVSNITEISIAQLFALVKTFDKNFYLNATDRPDREAEIAAAEKQKPSKNEKKIYDGQISLETLNEPKPAPELEPPQAAADPSAITEGEISEHLAAGSGTQDGRIRIYSFFASESDEKKRADFLKKEYGWSGASWRDENGISQGRAAAPGKGITITKGEKTAVLKWADAARRIARLIDEGRYLNDEEKERLTPLEPPEKKYDLGYGHMGNGLVVWNRAEERDGDYVAVAHIGRDRSVKFYDGDMPEHVKARIEKIARTSDARTSATQDAPVFNTPPQPPLLDAPAPEPSEPPESAPPSPPLSEKLYEELSPTNGETTAYYLIHYPDGVEVAATLNEDTLALIKEKADAYVICTEACHLSESDMARLNIEFRKMPRDWNLLPDKARERIRAVRPEYEQQWRELYGRQEFNSVETKPPETPDYTRFAVGGISGAFVNSHFDLLPGDPAASPQNYNRVTTASSRAVRLEFMYCKTLKIMYQLTINPFNTKRQHKTILIVRDKLNRPLEFYN